MFVAWYTTVTLLYIGAAQSVETTIAAAQHYHISSATTISTCNVSRAVSPHSLTHVTYEQTDEQPIACYYTISTNKNYQIILTFGWYEPKRIDDSSSKTSRDNCIHIFENIHENFYDNVYENVDDDTRARVYRFYYEQRPSQFVSVNDTVYLVVLHDHHISVDFTIEVLPTVDCSRADEFQCSSVECVPNYMVCDGLGQCSNDMDEYCVPLSKPAIRSLNNDLLPPCFLCDDGQCIAPIRTTYGFGPGFVWEENWWLCDIYRHCRDGSDEHKDTCHDLVNRRNALFSCEFDNTTISLPKRKMCDRVENCDDLMDERDCPPHKDLHATQGAVPSPDADPRTSTQNAVTLLVICIAFAAVLCVLVCSNKVTNLGRILDIHKPKKNRDNYENSKYNV